jgi:hypothetical protein
MRALLNILLFVIAWALLIQTAEAHKATVKFTNSCDKPWIIDDVSFTVDDVVVKVVHVGFYLDAGSETTQEFRGLPKETNNVEPATHYSGFGDGSHATGVSIYDLTAVPVQYNSYFDSTQPALYVGYDVRGAGHPTFCAHPLLFFTDTETFVCHDLYPPTYPVLGGSMTVSLEEEYIIPTLSEWALIIFVVLLAGWMTVVVVRRWRAPHATAA